MALEGRESTSGGSYETGELSLEKAVNSGISEPYEIGEPAREDGTNETRLLARDLAIETEDAAREGARGLSDIESRRGLRSSVEVPYMESMYAWNTAGLIQLSACSRLKKGCVK
jgi:hypothetical protein